MINKNNGTFLCDDVTILLNDISGTIEPKPAKERERLIQGGVHYSEMLPLESKPSERYLAEYYRALNNFSEHMANAVMIVSEKIYKEKGKDVTLVSLARAGTPIGVLIKRYLSYKYGINAPHYTISIVRGKGIDKIAMGIILSKHPACDIQFIDGWTGKGAILNELNAAVSELMGKQNERTILAVVADPANITDVCGTHEDIPIASSFLNSTVCGLMSRTIIPPNIKDNELHGVVFFHELYDEDKTYEFINRIESYFHIDDTISKDRQNSTIPHIADSLAHTLNQKQHDIKGIDEVREIAKKLQIKDINFIKPGIGEATRVLLRRIPDMILIAEAAPPKYVAHLIQLAEEKHVPIIRYPLKCYNACGIIKTLTPDL